MSYTHISLHEMEESFCHQVKIYLAEKQQEFTVTCDMGNILTWPSLTSAIPYQDKRLFSLLFGVLT